MHCAVVCRAAEHDVARETGVFEDFFRRDTLDPLLSIKSFSLECFNLKKQFLVFETGLPNLTKLNCKSSYTRNWCCERQGEQPERVSVHLCALTLALSRSRMRSALEQRVMRRAHLKTPHDTHAAKASNATQLAFLQMRRPSSENCLGAK